MNDRKTRLLPLFLPIFFELLLAMLTGVVDTLMLSTEGDRAVGAVGTANSYIGLFLILFSVVSSGMTAVMTQYIGANRPGVAQKALRLGLLVNLTMGVVISGILFFGAGWILKTVGIAEELLDASSVYLKTVGIFGICSAITPIFSSYLRSFGHTSATMVGAVAANIVNVALNAVFLFVCDMGVLGVALATGISRVVNLCWVIGASCFQIRPVKENSTVKNGELLGKILRVGLPAAMESSLYSMAIAIVISLLNRMDSTGAQATARAYAVQISNFSYCACHALAMANSILVGWRIGAGQLQECDRGTRRVACIGIGQAVLVASLFAVFAKPILSLFTEDPDMIRLVSIILVVDIFLEIGRATNLVFGIALKTSGDATYPMIIAVVFAFLCAAGGTWLFGMKLGWLAVGAYVGMALDECVRAVFMFLRWHRGHWKRKKLTS